MTTLATLQREFQACVLGEGDAALPHVTGTDAADVGARVGIYRHAYGARLAEVLAADFPALYRSVGADDFSNLANSYIRSHRSRLRNVRWYGADFPAHVASRRGNADGDLATLEWMLGLAFDAPDAPVMPHAALGNVAVDEWTTIRFVLHPSVQRADLLSGTAPAWRQLQLEDPEAASPGDTAPVPLVVWRKGNEPYFRSLESDEAQAIDATLRGDSFAAVCEGLCAWHDPEQATARAATLIGNWIGDDMLSSWAA